MAKAEIQENKTKRFQLTIFLFKKFSDTSLSHFITVFDIIFSY